MSVIAEVRDLVKYYYNGDNVVKAVDHIDLEIERGKFTFFLFKPSDMT